MVIEERYPSEQLDQMYQQLWYCVLQFADFSATQERHRIARDLHDSLGYALTALNIQLQAAMKLCQPDPSQAQEFLTKAHQLVAIATQEVRQSVQALRDVPEEQSLESLIDSLVRDFEQTTGALISVEMNVAIAVPPHLTTTVYRIVQESLNNARKYAQATQVEIQIDTNQTAVYLMIRDNGRGFNVDAIASGYGLRGMQERVAAFQGSLTVQSQPNLGCCIIAEIPMQLPNVATQFAERRVFQQPTPTIEISEWQPFNLDSWQLENYPNHLDLSLKII